MATLLELAALCCLALAFLIADAKKSPRHISSEDVEQTNELRPNIYRTKKKLACGYDSCHKSKKGYLNVHLVPHSHDDVGWLKTVDQYYYGSKQVIQKAGVQYILDSVVRELLHDPKKRFVYVETAFFWKWWQEQHDTVRHQVKKLVYNGQLEFIGGGWTMNDEAVTHYQSIVDQFTWGFRKLNDTFGACGVPRVGWQIDPFGHSREDASIMANMGFDGLFLGRIDWQDKTHRKMNQTMEMIWKASANLGKASELWTSVLYNTYSAPPGFCFDVYCKDTPLVESRKSPEYNADIRVDSFLGIVQGMTDHYRSNEVLVTMGDDFQYTAAHVNFKNIDKLIQLANARQESGSKVNLLYSTPSCYLKAVNDEKLSYPAKTDDFFPYSSDPNAFWTGYYTSRPSLKYFERSGNNFLQVCKQLYSLADLGPEDRADLNMMREAMGVLQHHDAVTGTEKQDVANDYARILHNGIDECSIATSAALNRLMDKEKHGIKDELIEMTSCLNLNISECQPTESSKSFVVTLYNPLSRPVTHPVRVPVQDGYNYTVLCPMGKKQTVQIVPIPERLRHLPGRRSNATVELVFLASHLPPLGFRSYYISKGANNTADRKVEMDMSYNITSHQNFMVSLDSDSGLPKSLVVLGDELPFEQSFYYYLSAKGNNEISSNRSSGAYIFRPNGSDPIMVNPRPSIKLFKGPVVEELHQVFSEWMSQVIRVYKYSDYAEFNWLVGPIPVDDEMGKEVITRYTIGGFESNKTFYTDSNGREMLERIVNYRPSWSVHLNEPVSGNYYPVTTRVQLREANNKTRKGNHRQFSVITDRSQGATSLHDGQIELMLHRRILHDDAFGVGEELNEEAYGKGLVAVGKHYIVAGNVSGDEGAASSQEARERQIVQEKVLQAWTFISSSQDKTFQQWQEAYNMEWSGLNKALPPNVQILTLEPWKGKSFLLRLEHILEKEDDVELSRPITVDLQKIFAPFTVTSASETTLGANQWLSDLKRLNWRLESNDIDWEPAKHDTKYPEVRLSPMEIRTFIIEVNFPK